MRVTNGSLGLAAVAIGGYLAWHAWTGGRGAPVAGAGPSATHLTVGGGPVVAPIPAGVWAPVGAAGPRQGQLQTAAPYPGGPGPASKSAGLPGFVTVPGANCPDTSTDGKITRRSDVASQAWAQRWGVTPSDTTGAGRGVPYP